MESPTFVGFLWSTLTSVAVSLALTSALVWLAKSVISNRLSAAIRAEYDEKLETHKAQLKGQSDVELEKLRSSLQLATIEHQAKFHSLQGRRAEVIAKTYADLKGVYDAMGEYMKAFEWAGETPRAERGRLAAEAHREFRNYYSKHLVFLPKTTAVALEAMNRDLISAFNRFALRVDGREGSHPESFDIHVQLLEKLEGEIAENLEKLEDDFRNLLGENALIPSAVATTSSAVF